MSFAGLLWMLLLCLVVENEAQYSNSATDSDGSNASSDNQAYLVVIDAGSSHTGLFIYNWTSTKNNFTAANVREVGTVSCHSVLSDFEKNASFAGPSLDNCLQFAATTIPAAKHSTTHVRVGATAGMRLVAIGDPAAVLPIFQSIRDYVRAHFSFILLDQDAGILPAQDEGGLSWVGINYANGIFKQNADRSAANQLDTVGSLDLGGASTQFTVEIEPYDTQLQPSFFARVYGRDYRVYTRSFLCYGGDEAFRRYEAHLIESQNFASPVKDPCQPGGLKSTAPYSTYFETTCSNKSLDHTSNQYKDSYDIIGTGDEAACRAMVQDLFKGSMDLGFSSTCPFQDPPECAFAKTKKGTFRDKFLGSNAFYFDLENLQRVTNNSFSISPLDPVAFRKAVDGFCASSQEQVAKLYVGHEDIQKFSAQQCFSNNYISVLLSDIYELDDDTLRQMTFANDITMDGATFDIDWTLGYAVIESAQN